MPIYEFHCAECDKDFEVVRTIADSTQVDAKCPHCGSKNVDRRWTSVFAVTSKKS